MALLLAVLLLTSDAEVLKEMLSLAAAHDDGLRGRLEEKANTLQDPDLRAKTQGALDEIVAASALHARVATLVKEVAEIGGKTTLEAGGPAWVREAAGAGVRDIY